MTQETELIAEMRHDLGAKLAVSRKAAGVTQRELAAATFRDRTTVAHLEAGRARADESFWSAADDRLRAGGHLLAAFRAFQATVYRHEFGVREARTLDLEAKLAMWKTSSAAHASGVSSSTLEEAGHVIDILGPAQTLTALERFNWSVIARYEIEGPERLAPELLHLRDVTRRVGSRASGVAERSQLVTISAQQAALLAYMSVNLGRFAAAEAFALEASLLATAGNDIPLLAWVKGTQSFLAYYQHRYQDALNLALIGLRIAGTDQQRLRLLSNGVARAAGRLGDDATVQSATDEALALAASVNLRTTMTPCIDFQPYGWARVVANAATAFLSVGQVEKVIDLTSRLETVVADSDSDWSRSLVSLDEATALTQGRNADLDHAATIGLNALAASAHKPIASVGTRAAELANSLARHSSRPATRLFASALHEWGAPSTPINS